MKIFIRSFLFWLIRLVGKRSTAQYLSKMSKKRQTSPRILLVHPGQLGSVIMATPVLRALKARVPQAHVTLMVSPAWREIVESHPDLDTLLLCSFPTYRNRTDQGLRSWLLLLRQSLRLRRERYDLAINLNRVDYWWASALLALSGIPLRVAAASSYGTQFLTAFLNIPEYEHTSSFTLRLLSLGLQQAGLPSLEEPFTAERYPLVFQPTEQDRQDVTALLNEQGIPQDARLFIIQPGSGGRAKFWTPSGWATCASSLDQIYSQAGHKIAILLTGTPSEYPIMQEIARLATITTTIFSQLTLGQLAALFERAEIVLGVDSGALHLASTQPTPTVKLFGPTDHRIYCQWAPEHLHTNLVSTRKCPGCPAIPCGRIERPSTLSNDERCLQDITAQRVITAANAYLKHLLPAPSTSEHL